MYKNNDKLPVLLRMVCDAHSEILSLTHTFEKVSHPGADGLFSYYIK